jgi:hypothetical protein
MRAGVFAEWQMANGKWQRGGDQKKGVKPTVRFGVLSGCDLMGQLQITA